MKLLVHGSQFLYNFSQRMFGEFYCHNCHHGWSSGNAWAGKGQKCKTCQRMVFPKSLRPLKPQSHDDDKNRKPHQQDLCQKCQELGYNCRNYVPPPSSTSGLSLASGNTAFAYSVQRLPTATASATFRTRHPSSTTTVTTSTDVNCIIL